MKAFHDAELPRAPPANELSRSPIAPTSEKFLVASASDERNAQSARAYIVAARAAPHRKDLELNQANNFARLIQDPALRRQIEAEVRKAR